MENPGKKEFIAEIAELFKEHEETYEVGQWEAFLAQKKDKNFFLLKSISIAAIFLLVVSLLPMQVNDLLIKKRAASLVGLGIVKNGHKKPSIDHRSTGFIELDITAVQVKPDASTPTSIVLFKKTGHSFPLTEKKFSQEPDVVIDSSLAVIIQDKQKVTEKIQELKNGRFGKIKTTDIMEFLNKESKENKVTSTKKGSNWDFGVELLPTMTKSSLNLGAGLTTAYKISENFSISSGIAYIQLDAGQQFDQIGSSVAVNSGSSKRLISTDANISAIDIPISLTYNLNSHLYTSIGVSYFNVLSEKRNNNYLTELPVSRTVADPATGLLSTNTALLVGENKEPAPELPLNGNSYLGFFNFSIGRKQQIFKTYHVILEPFIKIPVGKLSNEDLKLTNGGMKLKFSF